MSASDILGWLIETSLAVSVLIVLVLFVRKPIARRFGPGVAYLLWLAPALRLIAPELAILPPEPKIEPLLLDAAFAAEPTTRIVAARTLDIAPAVLGVWGAGAIVFIAFQWLRQRAFMRRALRGSCAPSLELAAEAAVIAARARLQRKARLLVAQDATGPLVAGLFNPVIIVPVNFESEFTAAERSCALAHEMAHVSRGDLAVNVISSILVSLQWFNPAAHLAWRAFRVDQEASCDATVLAREERPADAAFAYGAAILKSAAPAPTPVLSMSNHLKERLMLLKSGLKSSTAKSRVVAALLALAGAAAFANYSVAAEKPSENKTTVVEKQSKTTSVSVIEVDDDESMEVGGKSAAKVEVRVENGKKTVRAWDKKGKLLTDDVYGPDESSPADAIVIRTKDGKVKTIDMSEVAVPPTPPVPPLAPLAPLPPEAKGERRVFIMRDGDMDWSEAGDREVFVMRGGEMDWSEAANCEGNALFELEETSGKDAKRTKERSIVCLDGETKGDPKARAEALRKAIDRMEKRAAEEAAHREALLAKMREELAKAESAAKN